MEAIVEKEYCLLDERWVRVMLPDCTVEEISLKEVFEILDFEENKFIDPESRYAWKVRKEFEEDYVKKGLLYAKAKQDEVVYV